MSMPARLRLARGITGLEKVARNFKKYIAKSRCSARSGHIEFSRNGLNFFFAKGAEMSSKIGLLGRSCLVAGLLAVVAASGCAGRVRVYDNYHSDWHHWDRHENQEYHSYWNERHERYRNYNRLNKDEQRNYWNWRHDHDDHDRH